MTLGQITTFLALRRNTSLLLVALLVAGTGEKLWAGFVPGYLRVLGGGVLVVGLYDALQTFLGAVYAFPGGWLTDRLGHRRSLILFSIISMAGYVLVLAWPHWLALIMGAFLFLAWSALSLPATFAVVASSLQSSQHTMGIGVQSMVRRVPMMIGPLVGGWLITRFGWVKGMRLALISCTALTLVTVCFQWAMSDPEEGAAPTTPDPKPYGFFAVARLFSPILRELLVSDILIRFCERIPYAWVIVYTLSNGLTPQQFGILVSIEMITAMACYIPVAHLADRYGRRPFVLATFVFFTLFPLVLIPAKSFHALALAFAVRGLKEFGEPARKALIIGEAAPELRARTYGAYYLIRDCIVTAGSLLGAWLWHYSPKANFLTAALCGAVGTLWFWIFVFRRHRSA